MRLLTNLETNQRKLLQIILLGQPELAAMLARPELRQLAQRIVARYHLGPLAKAEVATYVRHRLEVAGTTRPLFPPSLIGSLYRLSGGVPRVINVICDRALLGAFVQGKERVDSATLAKAAREVLQKPTLQRRVRLHALAAVLMILAGATLVLLPNRLDQREGMTPAQPAAATADVGTGQPQRPDAKPVAPAADRLDWPEDVAASRSQQLAYTALFNAWGLDYSGGEACSQAARLGMRCRSGRSGLDELRRSNRPAVLLMRDSRGQEFHAALVGVDDNSATFAMGAETRRISLDALAAQWSGHYTLLWRMPPEASESIRPGERSPAVGWVARQLGHTEGRAVEGDGNPVFDDALARQVRQFQLAEGLIPDGAVGPQTVMRLSAIADNAAPTLARRTREE